MWSQKSKIITVKFCYTIFLHQDKVFDFIHHYIISQFVLKTLTTLYTLFSTSTNNLIFYKTHKTGI